MFLEHQILKTKAIHSTCQHRDKNGNCDYKLTVAYDPDPDGISLDEEIQSLLSEMFNIAESYNCSMEADIYEVGGQQRSW